MGESIVYFLTIAVFFVVAHLITKVARVIFKKEKKFKDMD